MKIPQGNGIVRNRDTAGSMQSTATQGASNMFNSAMGFVQQWKEQKDNSDTMEAINAATKKKNDWKANNLTREGKAANGLTEDYLKFTSEVDNELSGNLSNVAKQKFRSWHSQDTERDRLGVIMHQKKQEDVVKTAAFNDGLNIAEETIRKDAKSWQVGFDHMNTTLELGRQSGVIPEEQFEAKKADMTNRFRTELGKNYYNQDKHDFIKKIDQFGFGEPEKQAYLAKYQDDLRADERLKKSMFSEEAKLIMSQVDDMDAQAVANKTTAFHFENAAKLKAMGYGEWASKLEEKGKSYDAVINFNEKTKGMTLAERTNEAASLQVGPDLDGSSIEFKSRATVLKEVAKETKLFHADPANYVMSQVQVTKDPEIMAENILNLQKSQGIMPKGGYKVLPVEQAKILKATWDSGDARDKTQFFNEQFKYGKHNGQVIKELGLNSALTLTQYFPTDDKEIELLISGIDDKNPIILDDTLKTDYRSAAKSSELYGLLTSVQSTFPVNSSLPKQIQDIEKAMVGISAKKVDPRAGAEFFDSKFAVMDEGDKKIFFPKTVDEDEVEDFLDQKKNEIMGRATDLTGRRAYRDTVWVNSPSGFMLADPKSGRGINGSEILLKDIDFINKNAMDKKKAKALADSKLPDDRVTQTFLRR